MEKSTGERYRENREAFRARFKGLSYEQKLQLLNHLRSGQVMKDGRKLSDVTLDKILEMPAPKKG